MKKKIIILVLFCIINFLNIRVVKAETPNIWAQFYMGEWLRIYVTNSGYNFYNAQQISFLRRQSDDMYAYCIEPGVSIDHGVWYQGIDSNWASYANISEEKWERVRLLMYYGYGYDNHNENKWYVITQVMIWQTIYDYLDTYYTNVYNGYRISQFESEHEELNALVNNHYKRPSFNNLELKLMINEEIDLNDINLVLKDYEVQNNDYVDSKIVDNKLIVKAKKAGITSLKLIKKDKRYDIPPIVYVNSFSQDLVSVGNFEPIEIKLTLNIYDGNLIINKIGEELLLENDSYNYKDIILDNVHFDLYADEDIFTSDGIRKFSKAEKIIELITNREGKIEYSLYNGRYCLIETISNFDNIVNNISNCFVIDNEDTTLNIKNFLPKGTLEFTKTDLTTSKPIPGTEMEIYTDKDELIFQGITDERGMIIIKDLFPSKYYIIERNAAIGYIFSDEKIYFEIKENGEIIKANMTNEKIHSVPSTYMEKTYIEEIVIMINICLGIGLIIYAKKS